MRTSVRLFSRRCLSQLRSPRYCAARNMSVVTEDNVEATLSQKHEFKAETQQLLDIVAKSLYSEREVFIRELVSNAADALEKIRYIQSKGEEIENPLENLKIDISLSGALNSITIEDNGIGMTKEELINNLGTIARSGSKEFMKSADADTDTSSIIGQFGVGFYSAFMVGSHVTVMTKSAVPGSTGYVWNSSGENSYEVQEAVGVPRGTRIVVQLKDDATEFCSKDRVIEVLKKHSNFVSYPIFLDGTQINTVQPIWTRKSSEVTSEEHTDFYKSISGRTDSPMYTLQFSVDTPVSIKAVLYVPQFIPKFDFASMGQYGISLYCRKVMVQAKSPKLLPEWLMFLQGVVDSEDIPLNLSRELLQESVIINKIKSVITGKTIAFLNRMARRDPHRYEEFYREYGQFLRIGLVSTESQTEREDLSKLLRFESDKEDSGVLVSLDQYLERASDDQRHIYYLSAPSREMALASPYYESLAENGYEVLFSYNKEDDVVLFKVESYKNKRLTSAEAANVKVTKKPAQDDQPKLDKKLGSKLSSWMRDVLGKETVKEVKVTDKQHSQPAVVTVENLTTLRRYLAMTPHEQKESSYKYLLHNNVTLELNPDHAIIQQLAALRETNAEIAELVAAQIFENALMNADLVHDPRRMVPRLNKIMESALKSGINNE